MLQKLAIVAAWWILAITVAEMFLNPIVYYYLRAPDPELVQARETGWVRRVIDRTSIWTVAPQGRKVIYAFWAVVTILSLVFVRGLIIGDPTAASPLVWEDSPYNVSHARIQEKFGGVEPLIVVTDGYDKDAMKDPATLRKMEKFQRFLEGDRDVGYSFSLVDILRGVNSVFHELEPKWGVIPNDWVDIGTLFFVFFSGSPPTETAKYVDASYTTSHVTFFCKNHKGDNVSRIIARCEEFILDQQLQDLGVKLEERDGRVVIADVGASPVWVQDAGKGGGSRWTVKTGDAPAEAASGAPFQRGDAIAKVGEHSVAGLHELGEALREESAEKGILSFEVEREGQDVPLTVQAPWKAVFKLAGGLIGVLAAANDVMLRNDLLMNVLGNLSMYVIMIFTFRSMTAGIYLLAPLFISNLMVNAYMAARNIGINVNTLPLVTLGLGFGIDYGLYTLSRVIEEIRISGDLKDATLQALRTSGKAVAFTAVTMVASTFLWVFSNVRFNAEMGGLLAMWMFVSFIGSQTLIPALILTLKPGFIMREAGAAAAKP
jgi:predicted RND superfamily exporter protein